MPKEYLKSDMYDVDTHTVLLDKVYSFEDDKVYNSLLPRQIDAIQSFFEVPDDLQEIRIRYIMKCEPKDGKNNYVLTTGDEVYSFGDDCKLKIDGIAVDRESNERYISNPSEVPANLKVVQGEHLYKLEINGTPFILTKEMDIHGKGGKLDADSLRTYIETFWEKQPKLKNRRTFLYRKRGFEIFLEKIDDFMFYKRFDGHTEEKYRGVFFKGEFTDEMKKKWIQQQHLNERAFNIR